MADMQMKLYNCAPTPASSPNDGLESSDEVKVITASQVAEVRILSFEILLINIFKMFNKISGIVVRT